MLHFVVVLAVIYEIKKKYTHFEKVPLHFQKFFSLSQQRRYSIKPMRL
jgi:uncharacterized protein HemY